MPFRNGIVGKRQRLSDGGLGIGLTIRKIIIQRMPPKWIWNMGDRKDFICFIMAMLGLVMMFFGLFLTINEFKAECDCSKMEAVDER